ncbi:MAG: phosphonate ABC transporter, permease protein PhnE [Azospira oryzae]|nr:MAG: phosphonate ABC transporter, permease protein PhnE [Azospira oryzae]PZP79923.1 MAG: phosphonate ABC transporter, permease protein PhnE [Azospira oryzae]
MRVERWAAVIGLAAAVVLSFRALSLNLQALFSAEAARQMLDYARGFFPPDLSAPLLQQAARGALETLAISAVGTLLAAAGGLALALPASGRLGWAPRLAFRAVLNFLRSVPELVWAALMVLAAGLGPFAGTLALALHTSGVLGRLFAETLENAPPEPARTLRDSGAPAVIAFLYGTLPGALPQFIAYGLYRWEINIRMATVLGFVGAGGLGQMLYVSLSLFQQSQALTLIGTMLLLVLGADALSAWLRRRLAPAGT